jgi:hypothetical protein
MADQPDDREPRGSPRKAFLIRVSPAVLAAVEKLAAAELRSVNAQVEVLLREALARRRGAGADGGEGG